jgi:hypothetical protein
LPIHHWTRPLCDAVNQHHPDWMDSPCTSHTCGAGNSTTPLCARYVTLVDSVTLTGWIPLAPRITCRAGNSTTLLCAHYVTLSTSITLTGKFRFPNPWRLLCCYLLGCWVLSIGNVQVLTRRGPRRVGNNSTYTGRWNLVQDDL